MAQSLANPDEFDNLFEGRTAALAAESFLRRRRRTDIQRSAADWSPSLMPAVRSPLAEMESAGEAADREMEVEAPPAASKAAESVNGGDFRPADAVAPPSPPPPAAGSLDDFERELERDLESLDIEPGGGGKRPADGGERGGTPVGGGDDDEDDLDLDEEFEDFA